jgi:hypothetical protein
MAVLKQKMARQTPLVAHIRKKSSTKIASKKWPRVLQKHLSLLPMPE